MGDWELPDYLAEIVGDGNIDAFNKLGGLDGCAKLVKCNLLTGLTDEDCGGSRMSFYGPNSIPPREMSSLVDLMIETMGDQTLITLSIAAVFSLALGIYEDPVGGWVEGAAILLAVAVVVLVTAVNDYEKEKQFRKLNAKKDDIEIKVFRNGKQTQIPVADVEVGEIVCVETGDILCADGIFVSGHNLVCDQSSVTGESNGIRKGEKDPFLLSGCLIAEGVGRVLVLATGVHSVNGKTLMALQGGNEETPLEIKLNGLADQIAQFGMFMSILTTSCLCIKHGIHMYLNDIPIDIHLVSHITQFVITGITMLVVAVPEGLPLAVTISLAYSVMKMCEDNILVRRLEACETMGGASAICSDKTGTLTLNKMTVVEGLLGEELFKEVDSKLPSRLGEKFFSLFSSGCSLNSTAYRMERDGSSSMVGSKTECAMLEFVDKCGSDFEKIRSSTNTLQVFPFSSKAKRMTTVVDSSEGKIAHVKGASEIILSHCSKIMTADGEIKDLSEGIKQQHLDEIQAMAEGALRTIGVAYKIVQDEKEVDNESINDLILLGIVGIADPVRPEVPHAVEQVQAAGVKVRMVTGDNITTARAIAKKCGIADGLFMEGPEFRKLSPEELKTKCPEICVLARSSPTDKLLLVETLKSLGEIVAVTGDGANDGPALKSAHVGFSMGITGTEIAKQASAIVLLDDNFKSIVQACVWGRNVFDSIRKFIQFQLTVNVVAVVLAFVGSMTNEDGQSPLKPVQLLWVNLIMDTMAALALATEPPSNDLLDRPPYGPEEPLITKLMIKNILGQAGYQLIITFFYLYASPSLYGFPALGDEHLTLFFNVFVMCQIFNEINCRKIHGETNVFDNITANPAFVVVMVFTIVVQFAFVEYGGKFAGTVPLTIGQWFESIFIGALSIPIGYALRMGGEGHPKSQLHAKWGRAKTKLKAATNFQAPTTEQKDKLETTESGGYYNLVHRPHKH